MAAALVAPQYLALNHFYSMNAFDVFFWALAAYVVVRLVQEETTGRWCLLGAVLGLGLLNKISVLWLGAGLVVGLLLTPMRRSLLKPGPWLAGLIAGALFAPYVVWEVRNGWPTREFVQNATSHKMVVVAPLDFVLGQVECDAALHLPDLAGRARLAVRRPRGASLPRAGVDVRRSAADPDDERQQPSRVSRTRLHLAVRGRGVAAEGWLAGRRVAWLRPAYAALLLLAGAAIAPLALPLLPIETYIRYARALGQAPETEERKELGQLGQFYADMHGWDSIVDAVAQAHATLTPDEQAAVRVFAPDYGIAGALDLLGRRRGLPAAISGHNNYWLWGPDGWDGRVTIVVGGSEARMGELFEQFERAGTLDCGLCMPYENGRPVWIARRLRRPVAAVWPLVKHYD